MAESRDLPPLIGESPLFLDLMERVSRAAPLDRPVLLIGERGTGKELIGARLHFLSRRWEGPFVRVNCAALAESLLESELFGHEAGAFTGAVRRRLGRFELADGGTLLLDEIANASPQTQEKMLRAIEYGAFERVGGNETRYVDARVIGVTNVDLPAEAEAGRFRHDLLDRLAFDVLTVPPLRARPDDIPLLAAHFGAAFAGELGGEGFPGFTRRAANTLLDHDWPGCASCATSSNGPSIAIRRAKAPSTKSHSIPLLRPFDRPEPSQRHRKQPRPPRRPTARRPSTCASPWRKRKSGSSSRPCAPTATTKKRRRAIWDSLITSFAAACESMP